MSKHTSLVFFLNLHCYVTDATEDDKRFQLHCLLFGKIAQPCHYLPLILVQCQHRGNVPPMPIYYPNTPFVIIVHGCKLSTSQCSYFGCT